MSRKGKTGAAKRRPNSPGTSFPIPTVGEMLRYLKREGCLDIAKDRKKALDRLYDFRLPNFIAEEASVTREILEVIEKYAGSNWAELWKQTLDDQSVDVRMFAANVDCSAIATERGRQIHRQCIVNLIVSGILELSRERDGPDPASLIREPFSAWVDWLQRNLRASGDPEIAQSTARSLLEWDNAFSFDETSWNRWMGGAPISKLRLAEVSNALSKELSDDLRNEAIGWFLIVLLLQNASTEWRNAITAVAIHAIPPQPIISERIAEEAIKITPPLQWQRLGSAWGAITALLDSVSIAPEDIEAALADLNDAIALLPPPLDESMKFMPHWAQAIYEARSGRRRAAAIQLDKALEVAWWRAGPWQQNILKDALLLAVSSKDKVRVKKYWDRGFYLRYDDYEKPRMDDHHFRRLAEAARFRFPDESNSRIPGLQVLATDEIDDLIENALKSSNALNRKSRLGYGRDMRLTPLLAAALAGSLEQVQTLLDAGADPSIVIPESGRTALSIALERAKQSGEASPVHLILDRLPNLGDIKDETKSWNQPSGSEPVWPLGLAIDLGKPEIVKWLLTLGVSVSEPCRFNWPPLYYTLLRYVWDQPSMIDTQMAQFLRGDGYPSIHDARRGAIYRNEIALSRQRQHSQMMADQKHRKMFEEVQKIGIPQNTHEHTLALIEVVRLLVNFMGQKSHRLINTYVLPDPSSDKKWTAVHFAAQIGNVELMKILLGAGGDPSLPLIERTQSPANQSEHCDAYWIAAAYGNSAISELLELLTNRSHKV